MKEYLKSYNEAYFTNEFTFGFEFECFTMDQNKMLELGRQYLGGEGGLEGDGSLSHNNEPNIDSRKYQDIEYQSPIMKFNPVQIQNCIKFLSDLIISSTCLTNDSCGFHVHLGFPDKENLGEQMFWVLLNLISDEDKSNTLIELLNFDDDVKFYSNDYAGFDFLLKLKNSTNEILQAKALVKNYKTSKGDLYDTIRQLYSSEKYRILRMHPQGTMEWRGPRDFMNTQNRANIVKFFTKKLYPFVMFISNALDTKEITINEVKITKNEIYELLQYKNFMPKPKRAAGLFHPEMDSDRIRIIMSRWGSKIKFGKGTTNLYLDEYEEDGKTKLAIMSGEVVDATLINTSIFRGNYTNCKMTDCYFLTKQDLRNKDLESMVFTELNIKKSELRNFQTNQRDTFRFQIYESKVIDSSMKNPALIDSEISNSFIVGGSMDECKVTNKSDIRATSIRVNSTISDSTVKDGSEIESSTVNNCKLESCDNISRSKLDNCYINNIEHLNRSRFTNCIIKQSKHYDDNNRSIFTNCNIETDSYFNDAIFINSTIKENQEESDKRIIKNSIFIDSKYFVNEKLVPEESGRGSRIFKLYIKAVEIIKNTIETKRKIVGTYTINTGLTWLYRNNSNIRTCQTCNGSGLLDTLTCPRCLGTKTSHMYQDVSRIGNFIGITNNFLATYPLIKKYRRYEHLACATTQCPECHDNRHKESDEYYSYCGNCFNSIVPIIALNEEQCNNIMKRKQLDYNTELENAYYYVKLYKERKAE